MRIFQPQAMSEIGRRANQEDAIFPLAGNATTNDRLFVVCDGMGGHEAGEVASNSVTTSFGEYLKEANPANFTTETFRKALTYAYDQLDELDTNPNNPRKMGTTLTFLYIGDKNAMIAHIGDSRVYQLRRNEYGIMTIVHKTEDHSLVNDLVRAQIITPEEAKTHPRRNVITRAMQPNLQDRCKATVWETNDLLDGDYFFLCSDGVLESIEDDTLTNILGSDATDEDKLNQIKELCSQNSKDNNSAYLIHIEEGYIIAANDIIARESSIAPEPSTKQPAIPVENAPVQAPQDDTTSFRPASVTPVHAPKAAPAPRNTHHAPAQPTNHNNTPIGGGQEKKRPFSNGILAGLAVAALLLLGAGGYLTYAKFMDDNKEPSKENTEVKEQPTEEQTSEEPATTTTPTATSSTTTSSRSGNSNSGTTNTPPQKTINITPQTDNNSKGNTTQSRAQMTNEETDQNKDKDNDNDKDKQKTAQDIQDQLLKNTGKPNLQDLNQPKPEEKKEKKPTDIGETLQETLKI